MNRTNDRSPLRISRPLRALLCTAGSLGALSACAQILGYPSDAVGDAGILDAAQSDSGSTDANLADASLADSSIGRLMEAGSAQDATVSDAGNADATDVPDGSTGTDAAASDAGVGNQDGSGVLQCGNPTNPAIDPLNCGRCGHSCQGGLCNGGVCEPVQMAWGQRWPIGIAVDSVAAYWTDNANGNVLRAPLDGGAVTTLFSGQNLPWGVATDGANVYWANDSVAVNLATPPGDGGTIMKGALDGGAIVTLAGGLIGATYLTVDGTNVYFSTSSTNGGFVGAVPIAGGAVTTLASGQLGANFLATDESNVYWAVFDYGGDGMILRCAKAGCNGEPTQLATGYNVAQGLAIKGSALYFTANTTDGSVGEVSVDGGAVRILAPAQENPVAIAADESGVYWVTNAGNTASGTVVFSPLDGGATITLATGQAEPWLGIAVDGTSVYWTNTDNQNGNGTVMRVAKP